MSIRLHELERDFTGTLAVAGHSAKIETGELFCHCQSIRVREVKLLRLIAELERLYQGTIALGEETVSAPGRHVAPEARGLGFVFQSYALWPHRDVRGNVVFPSEAAGLSKSEAARHADRHVGTVALEPFATRKPAELSGGQRQRVALARCLAQGASTILMDEQLANLDPHLRQTMEAELVAFHHSS